MSALAKALTPKLLVSLLVLGILLLILGEFFFSSGRNTVENTGRVFPTFAGLVLLVVDGVLAVIWFVRRQRPTALEEGVHDRDPDAQS